MEIKEINIKDIEIFENIRQKSTKDDLSELMQSIKHTGLMQPIGVKEVKKNSYILIWGWRRLQAHIKLGYKSIYAIIFFNKDEEMTEENFLILNATENIHRNTTTAFELGRICRKLRDNGLNKSEIASRLNVPVTRVKSSLDEFSYIPDKYKKKVELIQSGNKGKGQIPFTTAIRLSRLRGITKKEKEEAFEWVKNDEKSITEVSEFVKLVNAGKSIKEARDSVNKLETLSLKCIANTKKLNKAMKSLNMTSKTDFVEKIVNAKYPGVFC